MKKFLLTLLFCLFANPIFAQTTNIQIEISETATENLLKIKKDLTDHINTTICKTTNEKNTIEFPTDINTSCNP
ncbi:MAG: hypothetical protein ACI4N3_03975, partial [Alphaproteobacteria bacterium]